MKKILAYAAIYLIWGSTYLFIKFALESIPPFAVGALRFIIAGSVLYAWSRWRSNVVVTRTHWWHAFLIGMLMLGVGNGAVSWAEQRVPSGITALIVAIVPLFVVLVDWLRPGGERPAGRVLVGVAIGLLGLAMLIGPGALNGSGDISITGSLVLLLGSLTWSIATVYGRHASVPGYPPLTSSMQILSGAACLIFATVISGEAAQFHPAAITLKAWLSIFYLATFGSIIAFSAYSWLMRVSNPARIATYAYVNPVVAMFLGWLFAGETLSPRTLVAAGVVLGGVALITTGKSR